LDGDVEVAVRGDCAGQVDGVDADAHGSHHPAIVRAQVGLAASCHRLLCGL
jgi:hypothetical protein